MTTDNGTQYRTPLFAKLVIMLQSLVIIFFGFWMYQEYAYNIFFQEYVNDFIGANMITLIAACGIVGFAGTGLFVRSRGRRSIELVTDLGSNGSTPHEPSMRGGKLDTHTEQALIDMIRKTVPPSSSTTSSSSQSSSPPAGSASEAAASSGQPLPTLQRVDPNRKTP